MGSRLAARGEVIGIGRATTLGLDLLDEASIAAAAGAVGLGLHLVIDATGFLRNDLFQSAAFPTTVSAAGTAPARPRRRSIS
jgi:hypothetical protein